MLTVPPPPSAASRVWRGRSALTWPSQNRKFERAVWPANMQPKRLESEHWSKKPSFVTSNSEKGEVDSTTAIVLDGVWRLLRDTGTEFNVVGSSRKTPCVPPRPAPSYRAAA